MRLKNTLSLLLIPLCFELAKAQMVLEVATKTIEKTFSYNSPETIVIGGENATIKINSWEKNEVRLTLKLIAKNRVKNIAVEELENIKYIAEKKGGTIYLRNYFLERKSQTGPGGILKVEYELMVPAKANITVNNSLGNVDIKNIEGKLTIDAKFGNVDLTNLKESILLNLSLGDLVINRATGTMNIKADHANVNMENISGKCYLKLMNSDLFFASKYKMDILNIETKNGNVNYLNKHPEDYNYQVTSYYGEIRVPEALKRYLRAEKSRSILEKRNEKNIQSVNIKSEYGNVTITE
jgi:hypothetical protein